MMSAIRTMIMSFSAVATLASLNANAGAEELPFTEWTVNDVTSFRTASGKFDDYMKFIAGPWKQEMEVSKKAGLIVSYEVLTVVPRGPDDADVMLVVTYKNWAALDGLPENADAVGRKVYGAADATGDSRIDLSRLRRVLSEKRMQILALK